MGFIRRSPILWFILLISIIGVGLIGYSTSLGPWAGSDSAAYLATAQNIVSGVGFRVIQPSGEAAIMMAPVYPLLLASIGLLGIELVSIARGLNMVLFGLTVFTAGYSFYRFSELRWLAVPVSVLCLLFPVMLKIFSGMMTEPLFLWLLVSTLLLLLFYLENGHRAWLVAAGLAAGVATMVRFIGAAFLPVGILAGLLFLNASWKRRLVDLMIYSAMFGLPIIIWLLWLSNQPVVSPIGMPEWTNPWDYLRPVRASLVEVFWDWIPFQDILPVPRYRTKLLILGLSVGILFALPTFAGFKIFKKNLAAWRFDRDFRIYALSLLFAAAYLMVFILIYLFRNPPQDINERTLVPLFPALIGMTFSGLALLIRAVASQPRLTWSWVLPWLVMLLFAAAYLPRSSAMLSHYHNIGDGYTSLAWRNSLTIQALRQLSPSIPIISSDSGAILFLTGRMALEIGEIYRTEPQIPFTQYGEDTTDPNQLIFREQGAALVIFNPAFYWQLHPIYQDQTSARLEVFLQDLVPYAEYPDGAIYFYPK